MSSRSLGESPARRQIFGGVLVVAGAVLFFSGSLGATAVGLTAASVGLFANSVGSLLGRRANRSAAIPAVVITALSMAFGATLLGIASVVAEGLPSVSTRAWLIIIWLAVINTAFANTLWNLSLRRLSAVASAGINNTMLLQIGFLAWWLLDEELGLLGIVGIITVSIGVLLTQMRGATTEGS